MESQQMMELLLAMREEARSNQANTDATLQVMQEKAAIGHKELLARLEAGRQANMKAWREEMAAMRDKRMNANHDETMACQEMEARQDEKGPTSVETKPEAAQKEVPIEDAKVMPVGEPKKKRRRGRKLAAERHHQMKEWTQDGCQRRLAAACRGTSHRAEVARKMQADKKMPRRATVSRRMRDIFRPNTIHCVEMARCKESLSGKIAPGTT
jgi:hypothetical protein